MIADEAAPALTRNPYGDHESREGLLVAFGGGNTSGPINVSTALTAHGHRIDFEVETFLACPPIASTLTRGAESSGKGGYAGRRQEDETNMVAYGLRADASRSGKAKNPSLDANGVPRLRDAGFNLCEEHAPTIETGAPPTVAFGFEDRARGDDGRGYDRPPHFTEGLGPTIGTVKPPAVATAWAVRRLMPIECERLQGFPDNFTNVPWRGKDSAPDGPRYKALGNSMACNAMRWIGQRIDIMENLIQSGRVS